MSRRSRIAWIAAGSLVALVLTLVLVVRFEATLAVVVVVAAVVVVVGLVVDGLFELAMATEPSGYWSAALAAFAGYSSAMV